MTVHPTAEGFDAVAARYEAGRPGYPAEALELVAARLDLGPDRAVLDLGAGTGKLTRELLARGAHVAAVEPVAGMRQLLHQLGPQDHLQVLEGTAEAIPLPDRSTDAVTVAQAFHWFDAQAALREIHRVLRPAGWLAVLFNRRDLATPLQAAIDELLAPYRRDTPTWSTHDWEASLGSSARFLSEGPLLFPLVQRLEAEGLVDRIASVSFVARLDAATRERVLAAVRELHGSAGPSADGTVGLHYVTELWLLQRRDAP